jgi:hypothetical protein
MRFFGLILFMSQHLIGPWWTSRNCLIFFREFAEIFVNEVWLSADNLRKVGTFRWLYRGKACNRKLFYVKAGFPMVKSMESQNFPQIILRKVSVYRGKSNSHFLKAYHYFHRYFWTESQPWVTSTTQDLKEKIKKRGVTENNILTFRR